MSAGRNPAHPVCHTGDDVLTWQIFSNQVARLVNGLKDRAEQRWVLTSADTFDFTVQLVALLYAGKQVVIASNAQEGTLAQLAEEFDALMTNKIANDINVAVLEPIDPDQAVIDLYTSGSTGAPKRVRKTLTQFEAEIAVLEVMWGSSMAGSAIVATVPCHHVYGLIFRVLWPLSAGRIFDVITCSHPDILQTRLAKFAHHVLISSPSQLSRLPDLASLSQLFSTTNIIFSSGGPLSSQTAEAYNQALGVAPMEIFGSTETGGVAWRKQCHCRAWEPLPGVDVKQGESGALLLTSPFLGAQSTLTMDDAIECLPNGTFNLLGRLDRIVKIEEKRLSLPELELLLANHAWVVVAAAVPLQAAKQIVGVAVELSAEGQIQFDLYGRKHVVKQLKLHLSARFEAVLLPRRWRFLEKLPMNAQGKLTFAAITALFEDKKDPYAAT